MFLSQLLLLFNFCHACKTENPIVEAKTVGSNVIIKTTCHNPKCPEETKTWQSQPPMPGYQKTRAGNFLLCMAVLLSGGSFTKLRQTFLNMGIGCVSHSTYFHYQRVSMNKPFYKNEKKVFIVAGFLNHVHSEIYFN